MGCLRFEPRCAALAGIPSACDRLPEGEERDDCYANARILAVVSRQADAVCPLAPPDAASLCGALSGDRDCATLEAGRAEICRQFRSGTPASDPARFLLAAARHDLQLCTAIEDASDRASCTAALSGPEACPTVLELSAEASSCLGSTLKEPPPPSAPASRAPEWLPSVFGILELLSAGFWLFLPFWLVGVLRRGREVLSPSGLGLKASPNRHLHPALSWLSRPPFSWLSRPPFSSLARPPFSSLARPPLAWLGLSVMAFLLLRFLLVPLAPLNFAEYGRLLPGHEQDLARLAYAFQPLLLRPLQALLGSSFDSAFLLNGLLAVLAQAALFDVLISMRAGRAALLAVPLLALNPVFLRMSGTTAETVGAAFAALLLFGLALRAPRDRGAAMALPLGVALLAAWRPEGVFLAPVLLLPAFVEGLAIRSRTEPLWVAATRPLLLLAALGVEILFLFLFLKLPLPTTPAGLLPSHAVELLRELLLPRFFSPLLLPLAAAGAAFFLFSGMRRDGARSTPDSAPVPGTAWRLAAPALAVVLSSLLLLALWTVQGVEKNLVFGTSRYAVMLLPWLLLAVTLLFRSDTSGGMKRAAALVAIVLLSYVPQWPLLWTEADTQTEFRFLRETVTLLPDEALVLVPAAPAGNDEFAPEAAAASILADRPNPVSWMPLADGVDGDALATRRPLYLLTGRYPGCGDVERLRRRCRLVPVASLRVASRPDLALFPVPCPREGPTLDFSLELVSCPTAIHWAGRGQARHSVGSPVERNPK